MNKQTNHTSHTDHTAADHTDHAATDQATTDQATSDHAATRSSAGTPDVSARGNVRSRINEGIDSATSKIGNAVEGNANAIAARTQKLLTSVAHGGQYLRDSEPKTLGADLVAMVKRHPLLTFAVGAGFGLFAAKLLRR